MREQKSHAPGVRRSAIYAGLIIAIAAVALLLWKLVDTPEEKAIARAREVAGNPSADVWDVQTCSDQLAGEPIVLYVSGYITGGQRGRFWLIKFAGNDPSGDVDIEPTTIKDSGERAYYASLRSTNRSGSNCEYAQNRANDAAYDANRIQSGEDPVTVLREREEIRKLSR